MLYKDMHHIVEFIGLGNNCDENKAWLINQQNIALMTLVMNRSPDTIDQKCGECIHVMVSPCIYTNTTFLEGTLIVMNCMQFPDIIHNLELLPSLYDKTHHGDVTEAFDDSVDLVIGSLFQSFFDLIKIYHQRLHYWLFAWVSQGSTCIVESVSMSWRLHAYTTS